MIYSAATTLYLGHTPAGVHTRARERRPTTTTDDGDEEEEDHTDGRRWILRTKREGGVVSSWRVPWVLALLYLSLSSIVRERESSSRITPFFSFCVCEGATARTPTLFHTCPEGVLVSSTRAHTHAHITLTHTRAPRRAPQQTRAFERRLACVPRSITIFDRARAHVGIFAHACACVSRGGGGGEEEEDWTARLCGMRLSSSLACCALAQLFFSGGRRRRHTGILAERAGLSGHCFHYIHSARVRSASASLCKLLPRGRGRGAARPR